MRYERRLTVSDVSPTLELMALALTESRKALPTCLPNPPVGCILARGTEILTRGYTNAPGHHHAEAMALAALTPEQQERPFNVYVTLEPCSFFGRTPSCALALTRYSIQTVYVGLLDPDPRNNGKGLELLRQAGIDVKLGILQAEIHEFLAPYLWQAPTR